MQRLPDGSAFFIATVGGPRPKGFIAMLKYTKKSTHARKWLYLWRNFITAYTFSRLPEQGPPMSIWKSIRWAMSVSF